jgi:hypothetical protein
VDSYGLNITNGITMADGIKLPVVMERKIITSYIIGFILIAISLVVFVVVSRNRSQDKSSIDYKLIRKPSKLVSGMNVGFIKFASAGSLLPYQGKSGDQIFFTYEAVNRQRKKANIQQVTFSTDSLKVINVTDLCDNCDKDSLGASTPVWFKNSNYKDLFYYFKYRWPRENFEGDYIFNWDPAGNEKNQSLRLDNLNGLISTRIAPPHAAVYAPDGKFYLLGERWEKSTTTDTTMPSKGTGRAVIVRDFCLPDVPAESMDLFELKDKFRHEMDMAWVGENSIAVITYDMEDSSEGINIYKVSCNFDSSSDAVAEKNAAGFGIKGPIQIIRTDPANSSTVHAFWVERETGYDLTKARHDIIAGEPGSSYFIRRLMVSTSYDSCESFGTPVSVSGDDIFIDGGFSIDSEGSIYAAYFCFSGENYMTRIRSRDPGDDGFVTRYDFFLNKNPSGTPLQPSIVHVKKSDGSDRIIILSKVDEMLDADYYLFALDKTS